MAEFGTSRPGSKLHVADVECRLADPDNFSEFLFALSGHYKYYSAWGLYEITGGNLDVSASIIERVNKRKGSKVLFEL